MIVNLPLFQTYVGTGILSARTSSGAENAEVSGCFGVNRYVVAIGLWIEEVIVLCVLRLRMHINALCAGAQCSSSDYQTLILILRNQSIQWSARGVAHLGPLLTAGDTCTADKPRLSDPRAELTVWKLLDKNKPLVRSASCCSYQQLEASRVMFLQCIRMLLHGRDCAIVQTDRREFRRRKLSSIVVMRVVRFFATDFRADGLKPTSLACPFDDSAKTDLTNVFISMYLISCKCVVLSNSSLMRLRRRLRSSSSETVL